MTRTAYESSHGKWQHREAGWTRLEPTNCFEGKAPVDGVSPRIQSRAE